MSIIDIRNNDCVIEMESIADKSIDLVVTSPPYDNLRTYNNNLEWSFEGTAKELVRVIKPGGVIVWVVGDATINGSETGSSFMQALHFKSIGLNIHDTMIWAKPRFTDTGSLRVRYAGVFEYMFVFSKGKPKTFNPIKDRPNKNAGATVGGSVTLPDGTKTPVSTAGKKIRDFGQRFNVWNMNTCAGKQYFDHPAQFPVQLANDHIISWSNLGDVVLDCFMGSGTTGVACVNTGRHFVGIEKDPEYFRIAKERIEAAQ